MEWLFRVETVDGWPSTTRLAYEIFNIITGLAYLIIASQLIIYYIIKRKILEKSYILILFMLFITLCATIRFGEVIVLTCNYYNAFLLLYFLSTASVFTTAIMLPRALIYFSRLKSAAEYQKSIDDCQDTVKRKEELEISQASVIQALEEKLQLLDRRIVEKDWYIKTHEEVRDLQRILLKANTPSSDPNVRIRPLADTK